MKWRWQTPGEGRPGLEIAGGLVALGVLAAARLLPSGFFSWTTMCWFRRVTGRPCPSCGATRAFLALARGRWIEGIAHNPLFAGIFFGLIVLVVYAAWVVVLRKPCLRLSFGGRREKWILGVALAAAVLLNWAYLIWIGE